MKEGYEVTGAGELLVHYVNNNDLVVETRRVDGFTTFLTGRIPDLFHEEFGHLDGIVRPVGKVLRKIVS